MTEKKPCSNITMLIYVILVTPFSIGLFLHGFFPITNYDKAIATANDIPSSIEDIRIKTDTLYQPLVKQLVVLVIDALRWDFVTGPVGQVSMPVTSSLIRNNSACLLQASVQSPTVTMPRIKAITTGTVPGFIDVAMNFGSKPILSDNILLQAKNHGHQLVFYGDETWLKLFPDIFHEHDGTTSFVVTDFTEVDYNVTRHIKNKLENNKDWSIMVIHYLGLDHIGHVHGPFSPLIAPKLREMDQVIAQIQNKVQQWNENGHSSLLVICGDHGMKDSGGHGGSTIAETTVPFVAIGGKCQNKPDKVRKVAQIDIAPTLSHLLGLPIPLSSIGSSFLGELYDLPVSQRLFMLYYNAKQVLGHFRECAGFETEHAYNKYVEAVKLHAAWLNTKTPTTDMTDDIVLSYEAAMKGMQEILISRMINYDYSSITMSLLFMLQILCIIFGEQSEQRTSNTKAIFLSAFCGAFLIGLSHSFDLEKSFLPSANDPLATILLKILSWIVLVGNCYFLTNIHSGILTVWKRTRISKQILVLGTLIHAISLGGSSFVEEEHQTWYFYFATLMTVLLICSVKNFFENLRSSQRQNVYAQASIKLFLLLIVHRVLRKLNSTGDKYAYLPDIAGWLKEEKNVIYMTLVLTLALVLLIWIDFKREEAKYKYSSLLFDVALSVCIYLRHERNSTVMRLPAFFNSGWVNELQVFWYLLLTYLLIHLYRLITQKSQDRSSSLLFLIVKMWVSVAAILHQPYNLVLLPAQLVFSNVMRAIIGGDGMHEVAVFIHTWIGSTFYFYQGNSNSLATIDVAAGYAGVHSYMPVLNGIFMLINTYAAPVLSYLLLVYYVAHECRTQMRGVILRVTKTYVAWRLLPTVIYTIIASIQRHHLFVWTVFSPKLLYESTHTAILCVVAMTTLTVTAVCESKNKSR